MRYTPKQHSTDPFASKNQFWPTKMSHPSWQKFLATEEQEPYFKQLMKNVDAERQNYDVYPPPQDMFSCFAACPLDQVKVVIIGQDPYHGPGQAHGMSFSVRPGVKLPPSLQNIFKELVDDIGGEMPTSGYLEPWAKQGVLLMNTSWSVRRTPPRSHAKYGWRQFSNQVLQLLNNCSTPLVFILWGTHAQKAGQAITDSRHLKISSAHPSPKSAYRGFFGSKPFSKTNQFLLENGRSPIDWRL